MAVHFGIVERSQIRGNCLTCQEEPNASSSEIWVGHPTDPMHIECFRTLQERIRQGVLENRCPGCRGTPVEVTPQLCERLKVITPIPVPKEENPMMMLAREPERLAALIAALNQRILAAANQRIFDGLQARLDEVRPNFARVEELLDVEVRLPRNANLAEATRAMTRAMRGEVLPVQRSAGAVRVADVEVRLPRNTNLVEAARAVRAETRPVQRSAGAVRVSGVEVRLPRNANLVEAARAMRAEIGPVQRSAGVVRVSGVEVRLPRNANLVEPARAVRAEIGPVQRSRALDVTNANTASGRSSFLREIGTDILLGTGLGVGVLGTILLAKRILRNRNF